MDYQQGISPKSYGLSIIYHYISPSPIKASEASAFWLPLEGVLAEYLRGGTYGFAIGNGAGT